MMASVGQLTPEAVNSLIARTFKTNGLTLCRPARKALEQELAVIHNGTLTTVDLRGHIQRVVEETSAMPLTSNTIDETVMWQVLDKIRLDRHGNAASIAPDVMLQVIDAFRVPHFTYHAERRQFFPINEPASIAAPSSAKAQLYRGRLQLARQRTLRNSLFSTAFVGKDNDTRFQITPIEALLGLGDTPEETPLVLLGMLSQMQEGKFYLEDFDGHVALDLSKCKLCHGLYTENAVVIVEAYYANKMLHVLTLGFPPPEPREITIEAFPGTNFFGGVSREKDHNGLLQLEMQSEEMFVVLSDVWLDKPEVLHRLDVLLHGYATMADTPPAAFVFMGNFSSVPHGQSSVRAMTENFNRLEEIISRYNTKLANTAFIFVPGPSDPGAARLLPRPPLPEVITARLRRRVPNVRMATNPCRIRYGTQELVFFREDLIRRMRRHCILPPVEDEEDEAGNDISTMLVKTLIDQGHLCPLPLHVRPVYWQHDQALWLNPLPTVLVLADRFDSYNLTYEGCTTFNPGPFHSTDFGFMAYHPSRNREDHEACERRVEFCQVEQSRLGH